MGGVRASKAHPRFEAMGDVDELNAAIGVAMAVQSDPRVVAVLREVQNALFTVGAELSVAAGKKAGVPRVTADHVAALEAEMGKLDIGEITEFILPRGSPAVATLHYARAGARRAGRDAVAPAGPGGEGAQVPLRLRMAPGGNRDHGRARGQGLHHRALPRHRDHEVRREDVVLEGRGEPLVEHSAPLPRLELP